uniref:Rho GTPase-activating protein 12-like n=1 Tax=Sinocyclocheilus anshuiensis TaxID=1608454 RepID=A0A671RAH3_9TELE
MSLSQQVLVNYEYKYTARDGRGVSIKPNEHYILVAKTNETWWHVRRDETDKPFFIPATYVTELPPETNQTPLDPPEEFSGSEYLKSNSETAPDSLPTIIEPAEVTLRVPASIKRDTKKDGHRISTYIIPKEFFEPKGLDPDPIKTEAEAGPVPELQIYDTIKDNDMLNRAGWGDVWNAMNKDENVYESLDTAREPESSIVEDDSALTAVYVNLPRVRRSTPDPSNTITSPLQVFPDAPDTLLLDSAGWEIHTDDQSGQAYYYHPSTGRSTWEYPLSHSMESSVGTEEVRSPSSFPQSPTSSPLVPSPQRWSSDWEKVLDQNTGRHYFFNPVSGQSSWDPPEDITSPGQFLEDFLIIFLLSSLLPKTASLDYSVPPGWTLSIDPEGAWVFTSDYTQEQWIKSLDDRGRTYYYLRDGSKSQWNLPEVQKNWSNSWTVLHGGILTFHKDPKSPVGGKTNQIVPEFTVELKGATINWATKDKSSKKNVLELKSRTGVEYLIQYDTESIITDWYKIITDTICQLVSPKMNIVKTWLCLGSLQHTVEDTENVCTNASFCSLASRHPSSTSTSEADQKKVRTKLKKFLLKRPTLQSVKDKGYIGGQNVFGCHLHNLCSQEKTRVPSFVEKCIRTVEKRGLGIDGLYRVSGNLAVIQKLRFKADHEDLDLEEGNWDIHVITGALKLFFRELQEPLFPYNLFNDFINGHAKYFLKKKIRRSEISHMRNLVRSLLPPNRETMEALFSHLRKVIQHGDENRMTVQNVAIVFGPTLLKPEVETANIATYMVFQNQIVEFLLNEFQSIFHM